MAARVTILPHNSDIPEKEQLKRVVAQYLERQGLIVWLDRNRTARRRPLRAFDPAKMAAPFAPRDRQEPAGPSQSVPGARTIFMPPNSPTWRQQHRLTVLGLEAISHAEKAS